MNLQLKRLKHSKIKLWQMLLKHQQLPSWVSAQLMESRQVGPLHQKKACKWLRLQSSSLPNVAGAHPSQHLAFGSWQMLQLLLTMLKLASSALRHQLLMLQHQQQQTVTASVSMLQSLCLLTGQPAGS
jgi:hypothetical protein